MPRIPSFPYISVTPSRPPLVEQLNFRLEIQPGLNRLLRPDPTKKPSKKPYI
jgi:hypothetical protein